MRLVTFALWAGLVIPSAGGADKLTDLLEARVHKGAGGALPYRLLAPGKVEAGKAYPLVVFLHGAGERGQDNAAQLKHGVAEFVKRRNDYPCYLVAPQCPEGRRWAEVDWGADNHTLPAKPSVPMASLLELIEALPQSLPIDPKRIYLTGLSMGGYGTFDLLARKPEMFAAAVPVCGGADEATADAIKGVPLWAFHGAKDGVVKPERSRRMIEALKKAGGTPKYSEYAGVGHDSWVAAYSDDELFKWLFGQARK